MANQPDARCTDASALRVRPIRRQAKTLRPAIPRQRASRRRSRRGSPRRATAPPRPRLLVVGRLWRERADAKAGRRPAASSRLDVANQPDARGTDASAREFVRYVGRPKHCDQRSHDSERASVDRGGALRARLRRCRDLAYLPPRCFAEFRRERADAGAGRRPAASSRLDMANQPDARRTDASAREFVRCVGRPKRCDQRSHDNERASVDRGGALRARLQRSRDLADPPLWRGFAEFRRERADA